MPEVTHDIPVRQVVDCKVMTVSHDIPVRQVVDCKVMTVSHDIPVRQVVDCKVMTVSHDIPVRQVVDCKVMPEVTHDIPVRQTSRFVDCKVTTVKLGFVVICICKYTWSQQDLLKVHGENHDVIVSFGLLFIILLFLS